VLNACGSCVAHQFVRCRDECEIHRDRCSFWCRPVLVLVSFHEIVTWPKYTCIWADRDALYLCVLSLSDVMMFIFIRFFASSCGWF
jgi:hypothetical protein